MASTAIHPTIYTIGHSTRSLEAFLALLEAHAIARLADIRTIPRSRRYPHFAGHALAASLAAAGIVYRHFPGLGGLRKPRPHSSNTAWRHAGFRGYADYMQTVEFERALDELIAFASDEGQKENEALRAPRSGATEGYARGQRLRLSRARRRERGERGWGPASSKERPERVGPGGGAPGTVIMCAEAVWWQCHRQLTADALVARGLEVRHILDAGTAPHALTSFARVADGKVTYPGLL